MSLYLIHLPFLHQQDLHICLYNLYNDTVQKFHFVARAKKKKKNTTKDFTVGLMGKEVGTGKTKLPARLRLMVCVCVCVMSLNLASVEPIWVSAL